MSRRSYSGPALDGTVQYITERPELDAEETVYATDPEDQGTETTENVPTPDTETRPDDVDGQTTLKDWGWSP